jgi:hypothetical protein
MKPPRRGDMTPPRRAQAILGRCSAARRGGRELGNDERGLARVGERQADLKRQADLLPLVRRLCLRL